MSDQDIRKDVQAELDWEPSVDATHIGVTVDNGVVTLTGHVPTYAQKMCAEEAVKRVRGVRSIAATMEVKSPHFYSVSDEEIAKRAANTLAWDISLPSGKIKAIVDNGWVTLSGEADWKYQRDLAEKNVRGLLGVKGVVNDISLKPVVAPPDIEKRIQDTLRRNAAIEAKAVKVKSREAKSHLMDRCTVCVSAMHLKRRCGPPPV